MHELSLAGSIVNTIEKAAARERFRQVVQLHLEVSTLAGVEPQALRFALTAMVPGTCLEGSEIMIDEIPGVASCLHCGASVEITSHTEPCSRCGQFTLKAVAGTSLRVVDILVLDD